MFRLSNKTGLVIRLTETSRISFVDKKEKEILVGWVGMECAMSMMGGGGCEPWTWAFKTAEEKSSHQRQTDSSPGASRE